jgi:protein tyrosine phosphatase
MLNSPQELLLLLPGLFLQGMSAKEATQYWYSRAHRALKQRWGDPQQMLREYQHVCALDDAIEHSAGVAKSRAASGRNRYCNVLPYDFNRCAAACRRAGRCCCVTIVIG